MNGTDSRPLVAHVVYRFAVGGLENGVVNLINRLPGERWRHVVIALTEAEASMRARIARSDAGCIELRKAPGHLWRETPRLARLLRELRPAIVHTRNLAALEAQVPAALAGVPVRVHGEHGWDVHDPDGRSRRYRLVRRLYRPFVQHYVALSAQIARYLAGCGVPAQRISRICNGVDTQRFRPAAGGAPERGVLAAAPFASEGAFVVGTVGRLHAVKDQALLVRAAARALALAPAARQHLRLVIVGDGPLRGELQAAISAAGLADVAWLAGERAETADWLRALDLFVLPSRAEGISNTILEAMACALPVIATRVGGNDELVDEPATGTLIAAGDEAALASQLLQLMADRQRARALGRAARERAERRFSLEAMVAAYGSLYERLLARRDAPAARLRQA